MGRRLGALCVIWCGAACLPAAQQTTSQPAGVTGSALLEIRAEMMIIGASGSHRAGSERAVLPPGRVGLLRTTASLPHGGTDVREEVRIELRVAARRSPDGLQLSVDSRAQGQPSTETVLRTGGGLLTGTSPLLYEAYVSPVTSERVVFLLSASPWEEQPAVLDRARRPAAPRPVAYSVRIYRLTEGEPELLDSPRLTSLVGHSASYSFGFVLEAAEGEPHREQLQVRLQAVELRDGWLSGVLRLEGEVAGTPVSRSRGWSLPSGGEAEIDLRLAGGEGLELGFRIRVNVRF